jgi:hypothetical protein
VKGRNRRARRSITSERELTGRGGGSLGLGLLLTAAGCGGTGSPPGAGPAPDAGSCAAFSTRWAATDYSSSAVGALSLAGAIASHTGVDLGADPALAASRGRDFVVARDRDLVFELDPACGTPNPPIDVHPTSQTGSANPQDVAVASDGSLWIPFYNLPLLAVFDAAGNVTRRIDLSAYDGDGNPDASRIAIVDTPAGEKAFVTLERLTLSLPEQPSWMLRVDVATGAVETHVELAGRNPFGMFVDGPVLWLADPGNFEAVGEPLAGVERFDTATSTTALVALEANLGGSVDEVAVSGTCGVAIVADPTTVNATRLATFNAVTGAAIATGAASPLATDGFDLSGLAWAQNPGGSAESDGGAAPTAGGVLLVGDKRRLAAGYPVHIFDATSTCALTERPMSVFLPLPPVALH